MSLFTGPARLAPLMTLSLLGLSLESSGCAPAVQPPGTHPALVALVSESESPGLGLDFWIEQAQAGSSTWKTAVSFCEDHTDLPLPNCRLVFTAHSARAALAPPIEPEAPILLFRQPSVAEPYLPAAVSPVKEKTP